MLLERHGVQAVADVRRYPYSRRHPHFNRDCLAAALQASGVEYRHLPELGGRREPAARSPNTGLRDRAFRGFADHMQGKEFGRGLERLLELAGERRSAVLCAGALPERCHRSLIADALVARGVRVAHVLDAGAAAPHALAASARVEAGRVTYPGTPSARRAPRAQRPGSALSGRRVRRSR